MTTTDTDTIGSLIDLVRGLLEDKVADRARLVRTETALVEIARETTGNFGTEKKWNRCPAWREIVEEINGPIRPLS
jgi:hypothetical protein